MKPFLSSKPAIMASRFILGFVFIIASIEKIYYPEVFALNIQAYQVVPFIFINIIAIILPWLELLCGVLLMAGVFLRPGSAILSALNLMFILLLISALVRGLKIDCGCFGVGGGSQVSWLRVIEDAGLLLLGLHIFYFIPDRSKETAGAS